MSFGMGNLQKKKHISNAKVVAFQLIFSLKHQSIDYPPVIKRGKLGNPLDSLGFQ